MDTTSVSGQFNWTYAFIIPQKLPRHACDLQRRYCCRQDSYAATHVDVWCVHVLDKWIKIHDTEWTKNVSGLSHFDPLNDTRTCMVKVNNAYVEERRNRFQKTAKQTHQTSLLYTFRFHYVDFWSYETNLILSDTDNVRAASTDREFLGEMRSMRRIWFRP